jgi:hypothetical protein
VTYQQHDPEEQEEDGLLEATSDLEENDTSLQRK